MKFAKIVRRSVHLTPFGEAFGRTTLVDEVSAESGTPFPQHGMPPERRLRGAAVVQLAETRQRIR